MSLQSRAFNGHKIVSESESERSLRSSGEKAKNFVGKKGPCTYTQPHTRETDANGANHTQVVNVHTFIVAYHMNEIILFSNIFSTFLFVVPFSSTNDKVCQKIKIVPPHLQHCYPSYSIRTKAQFSFRYFSPWCLGTASSHDGNENGKW